MNFPDEEVSFIGEDIAESYDGWRMLFNGVENFKGVGIGAFLVSKTGQHYPLSAKLRFPYTNNISEYEACILGLKMAINMNVQELLVVGDSDMLVHQVRGEWTTKNSKILPYLHHVQELRKRFTKTKFQHVPEPRMSVDALDTLSSMIQHPNKNFIYPITLKIHNHPAYCAHVEEEADGKPFWYVPSLYLETQLYVFLCLTIPVPFCTDLMAHHVKLYFCFLLYACLKFCPPLFKCDQHVYLFLFMSLN
ncbi:uncharacterized protein [Nicotiana sylvestris]|uniref:uncharacterized protein n=1 Tax=Nicotiana sylvestris TaxID=4096 RepID=UPI00388CBEFB